MKLYFCLILCVVASLSHCEMYEKILCHEAPYCTRNMFWENQAPVYFIDNSTISINEDKNIVKCTLKNYNSDYISNVKDLVLSLFILKKGMFRTTIKPFDNDRFEFAEGDEPFDVTHSLKRKNAKISIGDNNLVVYYFSNKGKNKYELDISFHPFKIEYRNDNKIVIQINSRNLFDIEFPAKDFVPNEQDAMTTIKMDIHYPESFFLTGLPERSSDIALVDTKEDEYYHFYNIDMFKYKHLPYSGLYGVIPYIMSHSHGGEMISGFLWNNPSETFIGVKTTQEGKDVLILSESGIFDFVFWGDRDINRFYRKFSNLIETTPMPAMFTLGYHQSRYSYLSKEDVDTVDSKFDDYEIPYDTIWFDIDHTKGKRYFTWNENFDGIEDFFDKIEKKGREAVVIIDPHIKVDRKYFVYAEALKHKYLITNEGKEFVGKCWCDEASYLDFYNKEVRNYWKGLMNSTNDYFFNSKIINIWNDMNEPSVFDSYRNTIPKTSLINYNSKQYEHRVAHNIYGYLMHKTTFEALSSQSKKRPFILTRSFYLGSHKYAAMWIGDAQSNFENLQLSIPILLSLSLSGYSFIGADVGGFAENGNDSLFARWYQVGVFYPFFRGHSHSHTYRREPWLFSSEIFEIIKHSIILRYQILPYVYREFYEHHSTGMPLMRPIWFLSQNDLTLDKFANVEYLFGKSILVRPVVFSQEDRESEISLYLPEEERWYNFYNGKEEETKGEITKYKVTKKTIGVFIKGGEIIPKKMRLRRSSKMMKNDPYTLVIALDANDKAEGYLYIDDEYTVDYKEGKFSILNVKYDKGTISFEWVKKGYETEVKIEKIEILGRKKDMKNVVISNKGKEEKVEMNYIEENDVVELKKMKVKINFNSNIIIKE